MRRLANVITLTRILCAAALLFFERFSPVFWGVYGWCGVSDVLDGYLARRCDRANPYGAWLDSAADVLFCLAAGIACLPALSFPLWCWCGAAAVCLLRLYAYCVGWRKYCTFAALHTYTNKAAGVLLFALPVLCQWIPAGAAALPVLAVAGLSAGEELLIFRRSDALDRDCKTVLSLRKYDT